MDVILHCLRKNCFIDDDDDNSENGQRQQQPTRHFQVIGGRDGGDFDMNDFDEFSAALAASAGGGAGGNYEPPMEILSPSPSSDADADIDAAIDAADDQHNNNGDGDTSTSSSSASVAVGVQSTIMNFLQNIPIGQHHSRRRNRSRHSHSRLPTEETEAEQSDNDINIDNDINNDNDSNTNTNPNPHHNIQKIKQQLKQQHHKLPTKASSFVTTTNDNIPTITPSTIVLPGSTLQQKMSLTLQNQGYGYDVDTTEDECVICMEGFDASNPRMPTLCGCGENKTFFHLPCLYHWIEQSRDCPSCRKTLTWQEF